MTNHAQKLIEATERHTLRPQRGDRARVLVEVLDYLIKSFAFDRVTCNEDDCGYAGTYIDVEDLHDLVTNLKKIEND